MWQKRCVSAPAVLVLLLVVAVGAGIWAWRQFGSGERAWTQVSADATAVLSGDAGSALELKPNDVVNTRSAEAVEGAAEEVSGQHPTPPRDFEAIYRDLVQLFGSAQSGALAASRAERGPWNELAGELFLELARSGAAVGSSTLRKLDGLAPPWHGESARVEAGVCRLILDFELQQMTKGAVRADSRSALVSELLDRMPVARDWAGLAVGLLAGQPYLGAEHESVLLGMAGMAHGELAFLTQPVKVLLVTVWKNLGDRRGAHLEELLRVFDDPDAGLLGLAAQQQLLLYDEYRDLVVQHVLKSKDLEAVRELAVFAAEALPLQTAIEVTATLKEGAASANLGGAYIALVERSQVDLEGSYRDALSSGLKPGHREQAVLAIANYGEQGAAAFAREAFDRDPEPRVRGVALLALGANADPEEFRDCYQRAVEDRGLQDPRQLPYLVSALSNHAPRADRAFLDTATAALLARKGLPQHHAAAIEALRRRYLD